MTAPTAPSPRRQSTRERNLREILDVACAQAAAGGPEAVSLRSIAKTTRFAGATALYRYFPSVEAIRAAVATEFSEQLRAEAARRFPGIGASRREAAVLAEWHRDRPAMWSTVVRAGSPGADLVERALRAFAAEGAGR